MARISKAPTILSSRVFDQDTGAKKAAERGPVFITDRGRATHVLLTVEEYQRMAGASGKIAGLLSMPGVEDLELSTERRLDTPRAVDLS